jgi:uncharacterized membrane protein YccC
MALRRAARAAAVIPSTVAFAGFVIHNPQVTTFVAFGGIALLVLADFAGSRRPRAAAYLGTTLIGAVLLSLGTLASFSPWVAALAMLLVGLVVSFSGVFGGYLAAAQSALLLVFVLAVAVPAPPAAIPSRLLGWGIAGAVSAVASVVLWPGFEHSVLRRQAATACQALAVLLRAARIRPVPSDLTQVRQAAETAVQAVLRSYAATPHRPAGPAQRDRAFVALLAELERLLAYSGRYAAQALAARYPFLRESDVLAATVAQTLAASGEVLIGGAPPDLVGLQAARLADRAALERWAALELWADGQPEDVLARFEADNPLRVVTLLVLALGADALIAAGHPLPPELRPLLAIPSESGAPGLLRRIGETVRIHLHLHPTSSVLQNSLRVAVGLALAVLLGRVLQVSHAFWVVLGTLSALRSSALATGQSTIQVLLGTVIGVAIGAPCIVLVGNDTTLLWVLFPVALFFAAYAATVVGLVAGQAGFTLVIIILFSLLVPSGWTVGLVRLEDVALGVGISVVVGLLLWPRGLRAQLRRALADLYHAVADDLAAALHQILTLGYSEGYSDTVTRAQGRAIRAAEREGEAFDQYLRERGSRHLAPAIAGSLGAAGRYVMVAADVLHALADTGYLVSNPGNPPDADAAIHSQVHALIEAYTHLADQLSGGTSVPPAGPSVNETVLHTAVLGYMYRWKDDPAERQAAIGVVAAGQWIQGLATLAADQEASVAKVVEAAQVPWWR